MNKQQWEENKSLKVVTKITHEAVGLNRKARRWNLFDAYRESGKKTNWRLDKEAVKQFIMNVGKNK